MKRVEELCISKYPWSCENDMVGDANHNSVCGNGWYPDSEDARLIAAAPELYEALREAIVDRCHDCTASDDDRRELCDQCIVATWKEAISKASGEEAK